MENLKNKKASHRKGEDICHSNNEQSSIIQNEQRTPKNQYENYKQLKNGQNT